jgi:hypothetical protein
VAERPENYPGDPQAKAKPDRRGQRAVDDRNRAPSNLPAPSDQRCRMHDGRSTGAPKGNRNNFQHGRYSAEAIAGRHKIRELVRAGRALARQEQV